MLPEFLLTVKNLSFAPGGPASPCEGFKGYPLFPASPCSRFDTLAALEPYRKNSSLKGVFVVSRKIVDTATKRNRASLYRYS
jgi:hypothetical protein